MARVKSVHGLDYYRSCPNKISDLPAFGFNIWDFFEVLVPTAITMERLVTGPWGCLSLLAFHEFPLNSVVALHRAAGSSRGTVELSRLVPSLVLGTGEGRKPRCGKSHVPTGDLKQGCARGWTLCQCTLEEIRQTTTLAILILPVPYFSNANTNSISCRAFRFCPVFLPVLPLAARLCGGLHLLP